MADFKERLRFAQIILRKLNRMPTSRSNLERATYPSSRARFDNMFEFLSKEGYITKTGDEHRAPYSITEKGKKMLEALA
jgi:predicted transcriptional regulator